MMKKLFCVLFAACFLCCAAACGSGEGAAPSDAAASPSAAATQTASATAAPSVSATAAIAAPSGGELQALLPFLDSVMLCQSENSYPAHDSTDAEYVWSLLYYYCVNYADRVPTATENGDGTLTVPAGDLAALASVFFSGLEALPALPDVSFASYDEAADAYVLMLSDRSETKSVVTDVSVDEEQGSVQIKAELRSTVPEEDDTIVSYVFQVVPTADSQASPFAIASAEMQ